MGKTINGIRIYICKRCGKETSENIYKWKQKPQSQKNICGECITRMKVAHQDAKERAYDMGYGGLSMRGWLL